MNLFLPSQATHNSMVESFHHLRITWWFPKCLRNHSKISRITGQYVFVTGGS